MIAILFSLHDRWCGLSCKGPGTHTCGNHRYRDFSHGYCCSWDCPEPRNTGWRVGWVVICRKYLPGLPGTTTYQPVNPSRSHPVYRPYRRTVGKICLHLPFRPSTIPVAPPLLSRSLIYQPVDQKSYDLQRYNKLSFLRILWCIFFPTVLIYPSWVLACYFVFLIVICGRWSSYFGDNSWRIFLERIWVPFFLYVFFYSLFLSFFLSFEKRLECGGGWCSSTFGPSSERTAEETRPNRGTGYRLESFVYLPALRIV